MTKHAKCISIIDHLICGFGMVENDCCIKVRKVAKTRNQYNQVPHLTQDTTWESENTQLNTTNESQEVSPIHVEQAKLSK